MDYYDDYDVWGFGYNYDPRFMRALDRLSSTVYALSGCTPDAESMRKAMSDHKPNLREMSRFAFWFTAEYTFVELHQLTTWKRFRSIPYGYLADIFLGEGAPTFYENAYTIVQAAHRNKVPAAWLREFLAENHGWVYYEHDRSTLAFIANAAMRVSPADVVRLENYVFGFSSLTYTDILKILAEEVAPDYVCDLAEKCEFSHMPFSVGQIVEGFRSGLPVEYMMALEGSDGTA